MQKLLMVAAAAALLPAASYAQVFKCNEGGKVVYQATPCESVGGKVDIITARPTADDRKSAVERAQKDQRELRRIESERELNRDLAGLDRARKDREDAAKRARCERYAEEASMKEARSSTWYTQHYRDRDRNDAQALRDKHFSECFGSGAM